MVSRLANKVKASTDSTDLSLGLQVELTQANLKLDCTTLRLSYSSVAVTLTTRDRCMYNISCLALSCWVTVAEGT